MQAQNVSLDDNNMVDLGWRTHEAVSSASKRKKGKMKANLSATALAEYEQARNSEVIVSI